MVSHFCRHRRAGLALAISLAFPASAGFSADPSPRDLQAPTVEVVGTTPIPGLGTPKEGASRPRSETPETANSRVIGANQAHAAEPSRYTLVDL